MTRDKLNGSNNNNNNNKRDALEPETNLEGKKNSDDFLVQSDSENCLTGTGNEDGGECPPPRKKPRRKPKSTTRALLPTTTTTTNMIDDVIFAKVFPGKKVSQNANSKSNSNPNGNSSSILDGSSLNTASINNTNNTNNTSTNSKAKPKKEKAPKVPTTPINLNLRFEDLGGLEEQICLIQEDIIYCHQNAANLQKCGIEHAVGGVLLQGPPGTGKTVCAHTIAAELVRQTGRNYSFYTHNAAACLSKWIGESEKAIRELFEAAAEHKPSIIFFDEFDAICPKRDNERSNPEHRTLVATILTEFNKIQQNEILVIATTNLVGNIDSAMIREGRFDFIINFSLPNETQRKEIVQIKMKDFNLDTQLVDFIASETSGFSGSALELLCSRAKRNAFKRIQQQFQLRTSLWKEKHVQSLKGNMNRADFEQVLKSSRFARDCRAKSNSKNYSVSTIPNNSKCGSSSNFNSSSTIDSTFYYDSIMEVNSANCSNNNTLFSRPVRMLTETIKPYIFSKDGAGDADAPKNSGNSNNSAKSKSTLMEEDDDDEINDNDGDETPSLNTNANTNLTNCFLASTSPDSIAVLNRKIIPQVLQNLGHPTYLINSEILDNTVECSSKTGNNSEMSSLRIFKRILKAALANGEEKPGILLIENIDLLPPLIPEESLVSSLLHLIYGSGDNRLFILATSSQDLSQLSEQFLRMFNPSGCLERSWSLPSPSEEEINTVFDTSIVPIIQEKRLKNLSTKQTASLRSKFQRVLEEKNVKGHQQKSYGMLSTLQSEIHLQCQVAKPGSLLQDIEGMLKIRK